ncbi:MAG: hypothetical protein L0Y72_10365 [Gemmataceae bacterium]|nr:hypothetical protein [Gemmataceae bacterium]MCI0739437.1 hypothetical protein [Gemmataceae bacterium]
MPPKPQYVQDLITEVKVHAEQLINLRNEIERIGKSAESSRDAIADIRKDLAITNQKLEEQAKRVEEWDRRWWGLIIVLIGALLSLGSGLIVLLARR